MQEEPLYEEKVKLLPAVDIGFLPEGWRMNFPFAEEVSGPKICGKVDGVDYALIRPDGVTLLHVHGVITTDGGDEFLSNSRGL